MDAHHTQTPKHPSIVPSSELQKQRRAPCLPQATPTQITPQTSTIASTPDADTRPLSTTATAAEKSTPWHRILQGKRLAYPLTQEQLAERAQIDWQHLQKIEAGMCNAAFVMWEKLATASPSSKTARLCVDGKRCVGAGAILRNIRGKMANGTVYSAYFSQNASIRLPNQTRAA